MTRLRLIFVLSLIILAGVFISTIYLIPSGQSFLELTQTIITDKGITIPGRYRIGLGNMATILFIIFVGMVF